MILHINHLQPGRSALAGDVVATLLALLEEGHVDPNVLAHLDVHLDWVQYKTNFRDSVMLRRSIREERLLPHVEVAVDLRQMCKDTLRETLADVLRGAAAKTMDDGKRIALEPFVSMGSSIIWEFNQLYWRYLPYWEKASGRGYEKALPGGQSDGHNADIIADSVAEFWNLLESINKTGHLPDELYLLEIGVGSGERSAHWLDRFLALDREQGTKYYPKIRFLLADYSQATLDKAAATVSEHSESCRFQVVDGLNPFKSLSSLKYKVLNIHLSNVYDNLPTDEMVFRDGRFYWIEVRASLDAAEVSRLSEAFNIPAGGFEGAVRRLLEKGPECLGDIDRGMEFWQGVWAATRLEERLVPIDNLAEARLPTGLRPSHLEELVVDAPSDLRFQLSSGAVESFTNTIPLLHPRGSLQVSDIFVPKLTDYVHGFRGPGKLDGSIVNWVNGALLAEIGKQSGYDVHFVPFKYRKGSKTSILYTTQRD